MHTGRDRRRRKAVRAKVARDVVFWGADAVDDAHRLSVRRLGGREARLLDTSVGDAGTSAKNGDAGFRSPDHSSRRPRARTDTRRVRSKPQTSSSRLRTSARAAAGESAIKSTDWSVSASSRAWAESNIQPDFNVSVFDKFDARLSAVLRELDEIDRFVQKSAESTSI